MGRDPPPATVHKAELNSQGQMWLGVTKKGLSELALQFILLGKGGDLKQVAFAWSFRWPCCSLGACRGTRVVQVHFLKIHIEPLRFYKRRTLVPVFAN